MIATTLATRRDALAAAADAFSAAGVETPRLDAELLLAEATAADRAELAADPDARIPGPAARRYAEMVRRRVRREPVAYILGRKGFRRIELQVDRRALVPRPETELLVELAVELRPRTVLDVGTGSGAVALAVADELPDAHVLGIDTSVPALELAGENAVRLGLAERVRFELAGPARAGSFDLVVANLPYVREDEWPTLQPEISGYEPREALVAGDDGLAAVRDLLRDPPGCRAIGLEIGAAQAPATVDLLESAGFADVEARRDLAGIDRVVVGRRPAEADGDARVRSDRRRRGPDDESDKPGDPR